MKKYILLSLTLFALSCVKDNGNYDYKTEPRIEITGVPESISVLASSDMITVNPIFTLKGTGKRIDENDPNYLVSYSMQYAIGGKINGDETRPTMNPRGNWSLDTMANYRPDTYLVELTIYDIKNATTNSTSFKLNVSTAVTEGWLVLCNEGVEKRVRLDMISLIGSSKKIIYDVLTPLGMPTSHNAYSVAFLPTLFTTPGDRIYVMTADGCYIPNSETFEINRTNPFISTIKYTDFIVYPNDNFVKMAPTTDGVSSFRFDLMISENGDVYGISSTTAGSIYEDLINTDVANTPAKYKVEPFIGQNALFQGSGNNNAQSVRTSLFYDKLSKSFVVRSNQTIDSRKIMTPLVAPSGAGKLFETQNTGMEMVWMENSIYDNGTTYAIMQDAQGKRSIYGFNSAGQYSFTQSYIDSDITATRFKDAKLFAFSSLYPYTYYAVDNIVYSYNRGDKSSKVVYTLPVNEKIRIMKFNLFKNAPSKINNKTEQFWAQQYDLIVCSYDGSKSGVSNGSVRILKVDGATNTLSDIEKYDGFADIVDIVYRERR